MSIEIYYFSGTGNSLFVARDIAVKMKGKVIPIPSLIEMDNISTEAEVIGIVFPIYNAVLDGMPLMIKRFIDRLENLGSKYVFAVCTCKGWSRVTISNLDEQIKVRGGKLSAGFTVTMPDNSNPTTIIQQQRLFSKWKKKLEFIYQYVNARKRGRFENTVFFNLIVFPYMSKGKRETLKLYSKLANATNLPYEELVPLSDRSFLVDDKCNGCRICANICPATNIIIINDKPVWQNHCESCLACINWCPKKAISGGITTDRVQTNYHHPDIKVSDMLLRV
jgi:ferredoxin/flavodoxin